MARKQAPHHGKVWVNEKQICDELAGHDFKMLRGLVGASDLVGHWCREMEIGDGMRPDFVFVGREYGHAPLILVVEVKITADSISCAQLIHYTTIVRQHANLWQGRTYERIRKPVVTPRIEPILIARYFDRSTSPFFDAQSTERGQLISPARFAVNPDDSMTLDWEDDHTAPYYGGERFDALLKSAFPVFGAAHGAN